MKTNCYIDETDIYAAFGVLVTKGGYNALLAFPSVKEPPSNDWPEEDGLEVDLTSLVLKDKEADISFLAFDKAKYVNDFIAFISSTGYHTVRIPSLSRTWNLRLLSEPARTQYREHVTVFSLRFAEDVPARPVPAAFAPGTPVRPSAYELDGVNLGSYGIVVEKAKDSLLKVPVAKMNMARNVLTVDGQIYDADHLVFKEKEVTFKCLLKAVSADNFWKCYDAFFGALTAPGERELYAGYTDEYYSCSYRSTSAWRLITLKPFFMVEFSVTLMFTSFRVNETEYLLATESGQYIVLEHDDETYIDMKVYG